MSEQEFYSLSYEDQWFNLIDHIYLKYQHHPFLFHALSIVIKTYEHSYPFNGKLLQDLHYEFNN